MSNFQPLVVEIHNFKWLKIEINLLSKIRVNKRSPLFDATDCLCNKVKMLQHKSVFQ